MFNDRGEDIIPKIELVHGMYYQGRCRNAKVARWDARIGQFMHHRVKFGFTFVEAIAHREDEHRYDVFDAFMPIEPTDPPIPLKGE